MLVTLSHLYLHTEDSIHDFSKDQREFNQSVTPLAVLLVCIEDSAIFVFL